MKVEKFIAVIIVLMTCGAICFGQGDVQIKKKTSFKIPGLPAMAGMEQLENRPSTVYLKGSRMRTDLQYKRRKMLGGKETVTQTNILQCDKQRRVQFNSKSKKYYTDFLSGNSPDAVKNAKTGGTVILTGNVTDTCERALLFGYEARRLKQSYTLTPGKNSCLKETFKFEVDGWYADLPEFSCPIKRDPQEFNLEGKCFDEVDYQVKGAISGVALKEIKTMTYAGMKMTIEEEVVELTKTTLADTLFEPPANFKAANTLKEIEEDDGASENTAQSDNPLPVEAAETKLSLPKAGVQTTPTGAKKAGVIRIGLIKPQVKLSEKDRADGASEIADAVAEMLGELFKSTKVETVEIASLTDAKTLECDYVFTANITQKKGGGLLSKFIPPMPGKGAMPNMNPQTMTRLQSLMMSYTKAKDEWTFEYRMSDAGGALVSQNSTKTKAEQYGEDVLSPQIKQASAAVLGKMTK